MDYSCAGSATWWFPMLPVGVIGLVSGGSGVDLGVLFCYEYS